MKKILTYINHNKVFVILLSVIVLITIALGLYYFTNVRETTSPVDTKPDKQDENISNDTAISSFQGSYNSDSKQIQLNWTVKIGDQKVSSAKLYHDDSVLADVSSLNSYVLNQSVYRFPGGDNTFILSLILEDGTELKKETHINVEYFSSMDCTTEDSENGILVKLTYKYNESLNIKVPRIVANSLPYEYNFIYKETKKEEPSGGMITETTIFEIDSRMAQTNEKITVRWIFDSLGMSYDFPITVKAKGADNANNAQ